jgi:DHA3 family multidrug efflux protein-like MFS transporter
MKTFYQLLGVALLVATTNNFVWFALTFWTFLTTKSVISTSVMAGIFLVLTAISGFWFGSIVDHHKKSMQLIFIPFMTTGAGVDLIGAWFGTGIGRGIALVFITAGSVGLAVTLLARRSNAYVLLAERY